MFLSKNSHCRSGYFFIFCSGLISAFLLAASLEAKTVRFAVVSDMQGDPVNSYTYPMVIQQVLDMSPEVEFVIVTGDLVWGEDDYEIAMPEQYAKWMDITKPWFQSNMTGAKVYPIPGNHDARDPAKLVPLWKSLFPDLPDNGPECDKKMTYSFDAGPCHLVLLNEYCPGREHRAADMDWLEADLAGSDQPVKLVFGHDPAYPFYRHVGSSMDMYPDDRDAFWQLLAEQNVPAYFCGHEHQFDHWMKDGVHQIISGGLEKQSSPVDNYFIVDADETDVTVSVYSALHGNNELEFKLSETEDVPTEEHLGDSVLYPTCPGTFMLVTLFLALSFNLLPANKP
jgi:3',5'-cyclic AMP phosphodiesterase CpdA